MSIEMDTSGSPDKAALATVLNYLRNKKLKDTEEALRKELTFIGGGNDYSDSQHSIEVSSLSGTEPAKYEESYSGFSDSTPTSTYTKADIQSATTTETNISQLHSTTKDSELDMDQLDSDTHTPLEASSRKPLPNLLDTQSLRPGYSTFTKMSTTQSSPTQTIINIGSTALSLSSDIGQTLTKSVQPTQFTIGSPLLYQVGTQGATIRRQILTPILTVIQNPNLLNPVTAATLQAGGQPIIFGNSQASVLAQAVVQPRSRSISDSSMNRPTSPMDQLPPRTLASLMLSEMTPHYMELKAFAEDFKTKRIRLGYTQGAVGQSLAVKGFNNFAQSTISRFEQMQLSPANAAAIKQVLEKWLLDAECPDSMSVSSSTSVVPISNCRKRKKRAVFTANTRTNLDEYFKQNARPNRQLIESVADELGLLPEEVRVWFCNKRQKNKSGHDRDSSVSTSSYIDSPPSFFESKQARSPSPKTPFTIEELSKSSLSTSTTTSPALMTSPVHLSTIGLMRPLSAPGLVPMMFNIGRRSPPSLLHTTPFVAQTRA